MSTFLIRETRATANRRNRELVHQLPSTHAGNLTMEEDVQVLRRALVLAAAVTLSACNVDLAGLTGSVEGSYSLRTINGYSLPYSFPSGLTVSSETLTMNDDGTFVDVARYTNGQVATYYGFYTERNSVIQFTDQASGFSYQGSVSGSTLTQTVNGYTQTYRRQ
jgi:hypothetical protein